MAYPSAQQHRLSGVTLRQQPCHPRWNITNLWTIANSLPQKVYTSVRESSSLTQPSLALHTSKALPISLTGQNPTAATAPGLSPAPAEVGQMWGTWQVSLTGILKADSHTACRAHAVPLPHRAVNSHMPCRALAMLRKCRILRECPRGSRKYPNC